MKPKVYLEYRHKILILAYLALIACAPDDNLVPPANYDDKVTDSNNNTTKDKTNTPIPEEEPNEFWLCANQDTSIGNCSEDKGVADENIGEGYTLTVGIYPDGLTDCDELEFRALIGFDVASLPVDKKIQKAELTLISVGMQVGYWVYLDAYIITSQWDSSSVTWNSSPQVDSKSITIKFDDSASYDITKFIKNAFEKYGVSWYGILLAENISETLYCDFCGGFCCGYCCVRNIQPTELGKSTCPELFIRYKEE